jgi:hypothetical protein
VDGRGRPGQARPHGADPLLIPSPPNTLQLPNVVGEVRLADWEHLDFIWGTDARERVYDKMVRWMVAMETTGALPNDWYAGPPAAANVYWAAGLAAAYVLGALIGWRRRAVLRGRDGYEELL